MCFQGGAWVQRIWARRCSLRGQWWGEESWHQRASRVSCWSLLKSCGEFFLICCNKLASTQHCLFSRYEDFNCVLWYPFPSPHISTKSWFPIFNSRFYALQSLDSLAETEVGREVIFSLDPSLQLLKAAFTKPTLAPDWQIQAITCIMLWTLNDDERLIPLVVEQGFIPFLLTFLPWVFHHNFI